jgi:flagella basal body P-ring formation protein FlgA
MLSALVAALIVTTPALALDKVRITVKPEAEVRDQVVRLDDVADIAGGEPGFAEVLRDMVVGTSPPLGKERVLSADALTNRLRRQRIDLDELEIEAPRYVRVYREAQEVSEAKIRELVMRYIETHIPYQRGRISLANFSLRGNRTIQTGETTYRIVPPRGLNLLGNASFRVVVRVDGEEVTKLWAVVDLDVIAPSVTALRTLPRGSVVRAKDLAVVETRIGRLDSETFGDISEVAGKRLARNVNQGETILGSDLEDTTLVRRGSLVTVVVEEGSLKVTARGMALEDGRKGKIIRVQNLNSKKTIFAQVMDSSTVRVDI